MPDSSARARSRHRLGAALAVSAWLLVICAATLIPNNANQVGGGICLLCGDRGLADALLNLLMFVPLGILLHFAGIQRKVVTAFCLAVSMSIEWAQISVVAGRDATAGDVVFNTLGGWLGAGAASWLPTLLFPTQQRARRLALAWTAAALLPTALFSLLVRRSVDAVEYWGQWNAETGSHPPYRGRVVSASLANVGIPSHHADSAALVRWALRTERPVIVRFIATAPPNGAASLFGIGDEHERQLLWIAVEREDLLVRWRMRAADLLLDRPSFRLRHALTGVLPGDTVNLRIETRPGRLVATVNGRAVVGKVRSSLAWSLLWHSDRLSTTATAVLSAIWIALLTIPIGWWLARGGSPLSFGLGYLVAQFVCARVFQLSQQGWLSWLVTGAAILLPVYLHRRFFNARPVQRPNRSVAEHQSNFINRAAVQGPR